MVRGLYTAGTGMLLQRRLMENITNNITNADTTGYKKEYVASHSFDEEMIRRINDPHIVGFRSVAGLNAGPINRPADPRVGPLNMGTQVDQIYIDFSTGAFDGTERPTDFALEGDVFFVVQTDAGERYTKCGAFYIDEAGYLVDGEANFLLGQNGPLYVGGLNFQVNELGAVFVNGSFTDTIRLVSFADNGQLRKQGSNLYFSLDEPIAANPHRVRQGVLETSNVDIAREMVDMITVYRTYETNQRMISMVDEIAGKAVNEIGRLR